MTHWHKTLGIAADNVHKPTKSVKLPGTAAYAKWKVFL